MTAITQDAEVALVPGDLAMVLLVRDEADPGQPVPTMTVSQLRGKAAALASLGIGAVKVFASSARRDPAGAAWRSPASLMGQVIREIKDAAPAMTVMTETCLCSYTETGECYLPGSRGEADVPGTIAALAEQAVAQADAGADIVGPAAMIRGGIQAVRRALDDAGHEGTGIMPHLIFDSRLYDPYRRAMGAVPARETRGCSRRALPGRAMLWAPGWHSSPRARGRFSWSPPFSAPTS